MIVLSEDTRKKLTDKLKSLEPLVKGFIDVDKNNKFSNVASSIWFEYESMKTITSLSSTLNEIYQMQASSKIFRSDIDLCIEKVENNTSDNTSDNIPDIVGNNINSINEIYSEYESILDDAIKTINDKSLNAEKVDVKILLKQCWELLDLAESKYGDAEENGEVSKLLNNINLGIYDHLICLERITDVAESFANDEQVSFIKNKLIDIKSYSSDTSASLVNKIRGIEVYDVTYWKSHDVITAIDDLKALLENSSKITPFINSGTNLEELKNRINKYHKKFNKLLRRYKMNLETIEQLRQ